MKLNRTLQRLEALTIVGLGISLYLSWVYLQGSTPVCFGSGGCAAVQHSPYAVLFGIPVPVVGVAAYMTLNAIALIAMFVDNYIEQLVAALFGISLVGVLFSAYLTYLELFVIRAICYWCVGSAVVMLLVFLLSWSAYQQVKEAEA